MTKTNATVEICIQKGELECDFGGTIINRMPIKEESKKSIIVDIKRYLIGFISFINNFESEFKMFMDIHYIKTKLLDGYTILLDLEVDHIGYHVNSAKILKFNVK